MRQAQDPNATFRVEWGPETLGFDIQFNQSEDLGVADDRDKAVRDLLRNVDFRKAMRLCYRPRRHLPRRS